MPVLLAALLVVVAAACRAPGETDGDAAARSDRAAAHAADLPDSPSPSPDAPDAPDAPDTPDAPARDATGALPPPRDDGTAPRLTGAPMQVLPAAVTPRPDTRPPDELLVALVQRGVSPVQDAFVEHALGPLRAAAAELGLRLRLVDVSRGAPAEVTTTPLLVHQDHRGRTVLPIPPADVERLAPFVHTARRAATAGASDVRREGLFVYRAGRARIALSVAVLPLAGTPPAGHDARAFEREARAAIAAELRVRHGDELVAPLDAGAPVELAASDRVFHLDFAPRRRADGTLELALELSSPRRPGAPLARTQPGAPLAARWDARHALFATGASHLDAELSRQLVLPRSADAFDPVDVSVPAVSWQELGLPLPSPPADAARDVPRAAGPHARVWAIDVDAADTGRTRDPMAAAGVAGGAVPPLVLGFPASTSERARACRVHAVRGELVLGATADGRPCAAGATGRLDAGLTGIATELPALDAALRAAGAFAPDASPVATFELDALEAGAQPLALGRPASAIARGQLAVGRLRAPLALRVLLEPLLDADGAPRLSITGRAVLRLHDLLADAGPGAPPSRDAPPGAVPPGTDATASDALPSDALPSDALADALASDALAIEVALVLRPRAPGR